MSLAEELLNGLSDEEMSEYSAMVDDVIEIDGQNRTIVVPSTEFLFGVVTDQNVERKYFKCPRFVGDNIDLSQLTLKIAYQNANKETDVYTIDDVTIDGVYIKFSWLLKEKVLRYVGEVSFALCAVSVSEDGYISNEWNTTTAVGKVLNGLSIDITSEEQTQIRDVLSELIAAITKQSDFSIQSIKNETDIQIERVKTEGNNQASIAADAQVERVNAAGDKVIANVDEAVETYLDEHPETIDEATTKTVGAHNVSTESHNDIRLLITGLTDRFNALANSDDTTLDQMKEVVAYIKANRDLIESVTTTKVNVTDIINNLETNVADKPLSSAMGVALKGLIDSLQTALTTHNHDNVYYKSADAAVKFAEVDNKITQNANGIEETKESADAYNIKESSGVSLVLQNTANSKLFGLTPFGKTKQRTTTGKQLWNTPQSTSSVGKFETAGVLIPNESPCDLKSGVEYILTCEFSNPNGSFSITGIDSSDGQIYNIINTVSMGTFKEMKFVPNRDFVSVGLYASGGAVVVSNPMIRLASIEDDTYEPYTGGQAAPNPAYQQKLEHVGKWGNLLPYPYQFTDYNNAGIVAKVNNDCGITFSGTSTSLAFMVLGDLSVKAGETYKFSGTVEGKIGYQVWEYNNDTYGTELIPSTTNNNFTYTFNEDMTIRVRIIVLSGRTVSETVYPQITYAEDNIASYRPYSGQKEVESEVGSGNLLDNNISNLSTAGTTVSYDSATDEYVFTATKEDMYFGEVRVEGYKYLETLGHLIRVRKDKYYVKLSNPLFSKNFVSFYDENLNSLGYQGSFGTNSEINVLDGAKYMSFRFGSGNAVVGTTYRTKIMISAKDIDFFAPYVQPQSHISLVGDGLKGNPLGQTIPDVIKNSPIHMAGVYWDEEDGQWYIGDTKDHERGENVQRIGTKKANNDFGLISGFKHGDSELFYILENNVLDNNYGDVYHMFCNKLPNKMVSETDENGFYYAGGSIFVRIKGVSDVETFNSLMGDTEFQYILTEPIITPMSQEEIASYKALRTNNPVTTITNDCNAFTKVRYLDSKYDQGVLEVVEKAVEEVSDVVPFEISLNNEYATRSDYADNAYVCGKTCVVTMVAQITAASGDDWIKVGTIPEKYAPFVEAHSIGMDRYNYDTYMFYIDTLGDIYMCKKAGNDVNGIIRCTFTYCIK